MNLENSNYNHNWIIFKNQTNYNIKNKNKFNKII